LPAKTCAFANYFFSGADEPETKPHEPGRDLSREWRAYMRTWPDLERRIARETPPAYLRIGRHHPGTFEVTVSFWGLEKKFRAHGSWYVGQLRIKVAQGFKLHLSAFEMFKRGEPQKGDTSALYLAPHDTLEEKGIDGESHLWIGIREDLVLTWDW
jgi:hypothetical protein